VPAGEGSIAVLARGRGQVDDVAGELSEQLHWQAEPPPAAAPTH